MSDASFTAGTASRQALIVAERAWSDEVIQILRAEQPEALA
jgi:hypothetical protein